MHSSQHGDTPRFCREVLCTERVATFLEENFVLWGGDIKHEEAHRLAYLLGTTSYPFFAVVCNFSNSTSVNTYLQSEGYNTRFARSGATILQRIQGFITEDDLLAALTTVLESHGPLLIAARSDVIERERDRQMVEMQNRDFEESLRHDREKEEKKLEEQRRVEEKMRQEQEQLGREEESRRQEEKDRLESERRREEEKRRISQSLPPEPPKSAEIAELAIRLTDGSRVTRRFMKDDSLKLLFEFIRTKEHVDNYVVSTHYPRKTFTNPNMTIQEAGFYPQATLFVEEHCE